MTYEELFLEIDSLQTTLPKCALPVLLRLVAKCIESGSNVLTMSHRDLAKELGMSKDAIKVAARSLSNIVLVESRPGDSSRWTLPASWFFQQRSLFASRKPVENRPNCPGFQDTNVLETRPRWASYQDTSVLETRTPMGELPGHSSWKPGQSGLVTRTPVLETRTPSTQNQQLTDTRDPSISISESSKARSITDTIDRVLSVENLHPQQVEDAQLLSEDLRQYMAELGPPRRDKNPPDGKILAECLAVAPLCELTLLLRTLRIERQACGSSYAWFVSTLAQRTRGVPNKALKQARMLQKQRKQPARQTDPMFAPDLLNQVNSNVRHMR